MTSVQETIPISRFPRCFPRPGWRLWLVLILASWPAGQRLAAEDNALLSDLALVPSRGGAFVSIRVSDLAASKPGKELLTQLHKEANSVAADLQKELGVPLADIERLTILPPGVLVIRTADAYEREKLLDALVPKRQREKHKDKTFYWDPDRGSAVYLVDEHVFATAQGGELRWLWEQPVGKEGQGSLDEALKTAAQKHQIVVGVNPAGLLALIDMEWSRRRPGVAPKPIGDGPVPPLRAIRKESPEEEQAEQPPILGEEKPRLADMAMVLRELPPELLAYKPLLQARALTLIANLGDEIKVQVRMTFPDADVARDGETAARTARYVLRQLLPHVEQRLELEVAKQMQPMARKIQAALKEVKLSRDATVVTAVAQLDVDPVAVSALALQLRRSAERVRAMNNLKQIALAFHMFHDAAYYMPPATIFSKDGKPLLSWRVAILPYLEQEALYRQFKLDEPWDSPHNKKLLEKMPKIYAPIRSRAKEPYLTHYQVFTGPRAPFPLRLEKNAPFGAWGPRMANFTDGTSNTLLVVEAANAVPWTKPEDLAYEDKKPLPKLGADFHGGFMAAFADGAVRFLKNDLDEETLRNLIMPADGNEMDWDKIDGKERRRRQDGGEAPVRPKGEVKPPIEKP